MEGGWPKDINMNDPEACQRYRRKIEKDDAYIHAVMHLGHVSTYQAFVEVPSPIDMWHKPSTRQLIAVTPISMLVLEMQ